MPAQSASTPPTGRAWPALDYLAWRDTAATLQLWTQVVGKVRLALSPWLNHGWQVPLYVNARGLGTSAMHAGGGLLEIDFDLVEHRLVLRSSEAPPRSFELVPMSVAAFYRRLMAELATLGVRVEISTQPNEVPAPIPFPDDEVHASYDAQAVHRFWRALVQADRVLRLFRTGFVGKASPVHFFWGSFDLAVTRFSGRLAPPHPGGIPGLPDAVTREAYSHEVCSAGFWAGSDAWPHPAFYAYAYPTPPGFAQAAVEPAQAFWHAPMGEFLLPYEAVSLAADPDAALLGFLQSTYAAAAVLAGWDRSLECALGMPGQPRPMAPPATPQTGPANAAAASR
ncbi:DUF5996 family protein [Azohydromonas caseinilytica]|uniref:Ava_C0101 and related proteins n=1 Tax=Azohydromonas caseinilytica TaxID=2728836 RepID=A0A848FHE6_9BURK|nr:DUF5996 family protein [Azohydromonas caseinilytica]NML18566.1 hypothetical protein [Azohydromonas caseinilytica]